jgi:cephalosporin-C deacetylase-like acetyl esterase
LVLTFLAAVALASAASAFGGGKVFNRQSLWNWNELRKVPFDVEVISTRDDKGYRVSNLYFTSEQTPNGPNRIFAVFARPINPPKPVPALLMIHGGGGHADAAAALWAAQSLGCATLYVDWSGKDIPGPEHFTKWRHEFPSPYSESARMTPTPRDNALYHIVVALHRTLDYMSEQPEVDMSKVAAFGGSWGGYLSLLLAGTDDRVGCVMSAFGAGGWDGAHSALSKGIEQLPADQKSAWFELFDAISYAKQTKAAVLMTTASNDRYFWLGGLMRHYQRLPGSKHLVIVPNSDHGSGGPRWKDAGWPWVRQYFEGKDNFPKLVNDSLRRRGRTYTWTAQGANPIEKAALYFSPGKVDWPSRYWIAFPAHKRANKWEAELPEYFARMAGQAYATVFDTNSIPSSSVTVSNKGSDPFTQAVALWPGAALWDEDRGADAWRTYAHEPLTLTALPTGGFRIGPGEKQTHFAAVTCSAVLSRDRAKKFTGLRLALKVEKAAGNLLVKLCRYTRSNRELAYTAEVNYQPGTTDFDLPWSSFKGKEGTDPSPYPCDGLVLEGTRPEGSTIVIESLRLIPR